MEEKLPFAGDIVRKTSVRRLNKLYFAYMNLSPEVQQAYELILYCGGVEDLLQKSEISQYELVLHKDDNWKIVG